jgi:hypothetical protein
MSTIVTRAGKGSALSYTEVDNNFTNLNTDKIQSGGSASIITLTSASISALTVISSTVTSSSISVLTATSASIPVLTSTSASISALTATSSTLTNPTVNNYTEGVVSIGTVTSASTLSLTNGTVQTATLTASTACTFTMPTATAGKSFVLLLKQAASTGNGTATFTGVKFGTAGAPTITATAGKMDILTFVADGTNWYGSVAAGYTP